MRRERLAEQRAREVVGLYGDPDTTWGIAVEVELSSAVDPVAAGHRLTTLAGDHPHLGAAPSVSVVDHGDWQEQRAGMIAAPYAAGEPVVRIAVTSPNISSGSNPRVLVGAHHGVCDGLGLLAIVEAAAGTRLHPRARGIGEKSGGGTFAGRSLGRLWEALRDPPPRFPSTEPGSGGGEHLLVRHHPRRSVGTVELCRAITSVYAGRRPPRPTGTGLPLFVVGASRRPRGTLSPDRQTAYLRFRVDPEWDPDTARRKFAALYPEPDFPETSAWGIGPRTTRLLRSRLGATAAVSNLGVIEGDVLSVSMFPALSGPRAVAFGLASTAHATTFTIRTRCDEFSTGDTTALLDDVVRQLLP